MQYRSLTTAAVNPAGDTDFFRYQLTAGDLISVRIRSTSTLDTRVNLLDAAGTTIAFDNGVPGVTGTPNPGGDAIVYSFLIPTTGVYNLQVLASGQPATTGTYMA